MRRMRMRWRSATVAATLVVAVAMPATAVAAPTDSSPGGPGDAPHLVVPGSGKKVAPFGSLTPTAPRALPGSEGTSGNALDPAAAKAAAGRLQKVAGAPPSRRPSVSGGGASPQSSTYCDEFIDRQVQVFSDESGAQGLFVDYYGDVWCNFLLIEGTGVAGVIDRTAGYDGQLLSVGSQFYFQWSNYGYSTGNLEVWNDVYGGARRIEIVVEAYLYSEVIWGACNPLPGLRYLACDGLGGNLLHVVVGTGAFDTGLQDPPKLFLGSDPGDDCPLTLDIDADPLQEDEDGKHRVRIPFEGTIRCPDGYTGTSQAVLRSLGRGLPLGERQLAAGPNSFANGVSGGEATVDESEDGGRIVRAIYSGRTVAPTGRTWGGCHSPVNEAFRFTKCTINGNVLEWEAFSRTLGTDLPDELHCDLDASAPNLVDNIVTAGGVARCEGIAENAESINLFLNLSAHYTDPSNGREVNLEFPPMDVSIPNTNRATLTQMVNCVPSPTISVRYHLELDARFSHYGGWEEQQIAARDTTENCFPVL